ncbi:MAG: hypothetical protein KatS3mg087_1063 [Patescibacteria group bacterium]|nr:MAG: hypothetical protein KatS3mg087_1063 [Patescibacteria group bacterium]
MFDKVIAEIEKAKQRFKWDFPALFECPKHGSIMLTSHNDVRYCCAFIESEAALFETEVRNAAHLASLMADKAIERLRCNDVETAIEALTVARDIERQFDGNDYYCSCLETLYEEIENAES